MKHADLMFISLICFILISMGTLVFLDYQKFKVCQSLGGFYTKGLCLKVETLKLEKDK